MCQKIDSTFSCNTNKILYDKENSNRGMSFTRLDLQNSIVEQHIDNQCISRRTCIYSVHVATVYGQNARVLLRLGSHIWIF